jgi:gliding motility-associated-like protein
VQAAFRAIWADSAAATAIGQTRRQPRTYNFTNFSSVDGRQTLVGIDSIKWTIQRIQDGQGNPVTEAPRVFWRRKTTPSPLTLQDAGVYKVTLSVANTTPGATCPASEVSRLLTVPFQEMPNVFTPNRDGMNDNFVVQPEMIGGKMLIFNRWGRKIREYASYNNDWDGDTQPAGVYYYQLTAADGKVTKGWVELVR